ncbi:MAG: TetR/AcrR family transcriptional regulator [Ilumatobacter sp.]|uniref:TetR/AcrR family transcriptional regulator n=1 Tax=Ilumatobacter sp. TaxID=1967498 RepID=UPI003297ACDA
MTVTLRERNRQAAMEQVRAVAFDLMSTHGFDAVTVEQIAARSSVSPSTVYRYFGTKEALVLSSSRPAHLLERLRETGETTWADAFRRAAVDVWQADPTAAVELGLIVANDPLMHAWERQLLDQRTDIAAAFAARRGKSGGAKDDARAAAAIGVLTAALLRWHGDAASKKSLDRLLAKAFDALRTD